MGYKILLHKKALKRPCILGDLQRTRWEKDSQNWCSRGWDILTFSAEFGSGSRNAGSSHNATRSFLLFSVSPSLLGKCCQTPRIPFCNAWFYKEIKSLPPCCGAALRLWAQCLRHICLLALIKWECFKFFAFGHKSKYWTRWNFDLMMARDEKWRNHQRFYTAHP